jgi:hypothetical protein
MPNGLAAITGPAYPAPVDAPAIELHETVSNSRPTPAHDAAQERPPLERLSSNVGNRAFGQLIARMADGEGILPSGLVHPHVEAAIAASRGAGQPLDTHVARRLEPSLNESLGDVRVHTGDSAAALARAVSARAFTVGNDIFFGSGEYRPGTAGGNTLIAHEVAHTIQQRGAPASGPLAVSQPGDALEREAEAVARDVTG